MSGQFSSIGLSVWQASRNAALTAADYMTPVLAESHFIEKGVLTPEEFVLAGDMLALRCPTWKWQGGDPAKSRAILPKDKQFLITRNVPCQQRAIVLGRGACDERNIDFGDGQVTLFLNPVKGGLTCPSYFRSGWRRTSLARIGPMGMRPTLLIWRLLLRLLVQQRHRKHAARSKPTSKRLG
jgi:hypothetical protein